MVVAATRTPCQRGPLTTKTPLRTTPKTEPGAYEAKQQTCTHMALLHHFNSIRGEKSHTKTSPSYPKGASQVVNRLPVVPLGWLALTTVVAKGASWAVPHRPQHSGASWAVRPCTVIPCNTIVLQSEPSYWRCQMMWALFHLLGCCFFLRFRTPGATRITTLARGRHSTVTITIRGGFL